MDLGTTFECQGNEPRLDQCLQRNSYSGNHVGLTCVPSDMSVLPGEAH